MTIAAPVMHCGITACGHKSFSLHKEDKMEKAFRIVEKVSVIALGVLAALTSSFLFIPTFALGTLIGMATYKESKHSHHQHKNSDSCGHGFIEEKTGVKLPESIALIAGFAAMAVHIDHHPVVFVPTVGITLGIWVGNLAAPTVNLAFRKFAAFVTQPFTVDFSHINFFA